MGPVDGIGTQVGERIRQTVAGIPIRQGMAGDEAFDVLSTAISPGAAESKVARLGQG